MDILFNPLTRRYPGTYYRFTVLRFDGLAFRLLLRCLLFASCFFFCFSRITRFVLVAVVALTASPFVLPVCLVYCVLKGFNATSTDDYSVTLGFSGSSSQCISMGENSVNICTGNGMYGVHLDGRSLASIVALVFFVYTLLMAFLVIGGYWLYSRFTVKRTAERPKFAHNHQDLTKNILEEEY